MKKNPSRNWGLIRRAGSQGLTANGVSSILRLRVNKMEWILPHKASPGTTPHLIVRSAQNLSVSPWASLFCLCLKRRSKSIPQLSLKGIIGTGPLTGGNDAELWHSDTPQPPYVRRCSEKDMTKGLNLFAGVRVFSPNEPRIN